jgi:L-alanine-DL-glutamate epimerase-like enolase superfamily enzyme
MHPESLHRQVRNTFEHSGRGSLYLGLAAVDVAQWDLYAKHLDVPLGIAMGRQLPTTKKTWEYSMKHPRKARLQDIRLVHRAHSGWL